MQEARTARGEQEARDDLLPAAKEAGATFIAIASRAMSREDVARWFRTIADAIEAGEHDSRPSLRRTH